ncbi:probable histone H2B.3 [Sceloporus undulatus]|uniref:probable histone H2B.3 n=1 Tax=Sceloporus undulatus TaxID=8520 RepID=UPI001C4DCE34|nr:probable histone H2B.3 [Sceloporus undulatus]
MASRRTLRRRPRNRAQARRRRRALRKRRLRSARSCRRQKPSARTRSRLPRRLQPKKKVRMTRDAWSMLHSYVDGIYRKVSGEAERLRRKERRPSIISSDVQTALRQVMPRKLTRRVACTRTR